MTQITPIYICVALLLSVCAMPNPKPTLAQSGGKIATSALAATTSTSAVSMAPTPFRSNIKTMSPPMEAQAEAPAAGSNGLRASDSTLSADSLWKLYASYENRKCLINVDSEGEFNSLDTKSQREAVLDAIGRRVNPTEQGHLFASNLTYSGYRLLSDEADNLNLIKESVYSALSASERKALVLPLIEAVGNKRIISNLHAFLRNPLSRLNRCW